MEGQSRRVNKVYEERYRSQYKLAPHILFAMLESSKQYPSAKDNQYHLKCAPSSHYSLASATRFPT